MAGRATKTVEQRFFEKIAFVDRWYAGTRCLEWRGWINGNGRGGGYGRFAVDAQARPQKTIPAHRWLYERWIGPIPGNLQVDHLCRYRACVNPVHLELVTPSENTRRGYEARRSGDYGGAMVWHSRLNPHRKHGAVCDKGHEIVGENAWLPNKTCVTPQCRICRNEWRREYDARRRRQVAAPAGRCVSCALLFLARRCS